MISKKKIAVGLAAVASMLTVGASTFSATSASAANPIVCRVAGSVTVNGAGISNTASATSGSFNSTTLDCTGTPGQTGVGAWSVLADFSSASETCAEDPAGSGSFNGGSGPGGASVTGGTFTFSRYGTAVSVAGTVQTSAGDFPFKAALIFVPTDGQCSNPTVASGTHNADIANGSTAVITP